jgi:hypothetical protein
MYEANKRQGTVKTKTRAEVTATTRKPYKQKGTGNARRGDFKSPLLRGGGVIFGPRPRDYSYSIPRKALREALRSALLGYDNTWRQLLDCVVAYERGDWGACLPLASLARVDRRWLPSAYMDALHWAHELQQAPPPSA